jgi:hypothetical protein
LPWFERFYEELACLFVLHPYCAGQVSRVFPRVRVKVSGNPEWEEFFPGPDYMLEKAQIENKLIDLGAPKDAQLILCPGGKDRDMNLELWGDVAQAAAEVRRHKFCLVVSMHPGDRNDPDANEKDLSARAQVPVIFIHKERHGINTAELVPASDFVIGSLSTLGDRACCQGKRVIDYVTPTALDRLAELNALLHEAERRVWPPCHVAGDIFGASRFATTSAGLKLAIDDLSMQSLQRLQREAQKSFYGKTGPAPGTAVRIMADEIERVLAEG